MKKSSRLKWINRLDLTSRNKKPMAEIYRLRRSFP